MKKTRLEITIEQKQMWRISSADNADSSGAWQTDKPPLLKDTNNTKLSPREIKTQNRTLKILSALVRAVNYALSLLGRIKRRK